MTTYKEAGVDIGLADRILETIAPEIESTHSEFVLNGKNGFASMFKVPPGYRDPVIVSSTDGVGTKLKLAIELDDYSTIGQDLVAMCVNDLITTGADPLYFLDYYATGKLSAHQAMSVILSIARACTACGMSLVGGETAEMPTIYNGQDFDLAGFATGMVDQYKIRNPANVDAGHAIIGIQSSGFHSNGYSLINHIVDENLPSDEVLQMLLEPTRLYVDTMKKIRPMVTSAANITGGGLVANIQRALPDHLSMTIDMDSWQAPPVFQEFEVYHNIPLEVQLTTFNMGIGFVVICKPCAVDLILDNIDYPAWVIGEVRPVY